MPKTILVVDDEQDLLRLVNTILQDHGYRVILARGAARAIAAYDEMGAPPDLLLTDVVMPGMSGPMLVDALLAREPNLRVLFMSGYDERQIVQRYVVEKGFTLITKPFDMSGLARAVESAIAAAPPPAE